MDLRTSLSNLGEGITLGAFFVMLFVAPVIASIVDIIFILLKVLGYIKWSWTMVIFSPLLIEVIPLPIAGIGALLFELTKNSHGKKESH